MNQKELKELIEFLIEKNIAEFELERGDVKVRIRRGTLVEVHSSSAAAAQQGANTVVLPSVAAPAAATATPTAPPEEALHIVKSPIVGTFYESPSPGAPPFVKPGDGVETGQVLCIIEAMKLMNEIEADVSGEVVKRLVANGQPIEYGQPLFSIRPHSAAA